MNLLLDTHLVIWALNDDPRLPERARNMILDEGNVIFYSVVSVWEVSIKHAVHPDIVAFTGKEFATFCKEAGFIPLEMREKQVFALETITRKENAPRHQDPFDRMLIAQAKAEKLTFLTHDASLPYYQESCIMFV